MVSAKGVHRKTLVLNRNFSPVNIINSLEAICKVYSGTAKVLGADWCKYSFDDWIENWEDLTMLTEEPVNEKRIINCARWSFLAPEIVVLEDYRGRHIPSTNFSRRNIFIRDKNTCQYCGFNSKERKLFNLDHVLAKSRGGRATWDNIVLSCIPCNTKKGHKTLEEANMKLSKQPYKPLFNQPEWAPGSDVSIPKSWDDFIGSMYWNTTLED